MKALYNNPKFSPEYTKISVLANRVTSIEEGQNVYDKLDSVVRQFLQGEISYAGLIPQDKELEQSVRQQKTVSIYAPASASARAFEVMASNILNYEHKQAKIPSGIAQLFAMLWKHID